jgi:putative flippase GtrA
MSKWQSESGYLARYAGGGVLNTVVGLLVIFLSMALGISPMLANIAGYGTGFVLGFVLSKKFVFRSNGHFVAESMRYLFAFIICVAINLLVLRLALSVLQWNAAFAQLLAAFVYSISMYGFTRLFVFSIGAKS